MRLGECNGQETTSVGNQNAAHFGINTIKNKSLSRWESSRNKFFIRKVNFLNDKKKQNVYGRYIQQNAPWEFSVQIQAFVYK